MSAKYAARSFGKAWQLCGITRGAFPPCENEIKIQSRTLQNAGAARLRTLPAFFCLRAMLPLPAASQVAAAPVPKPALRLYKRHAEVVGGGERQILGDTINVGSDPVGVIDIVMIGDLDQHSRCGCTA